MNIKKSMFTKGIGDCFKARNHVSYHWFFDSLHEAQKFSHNVSDLTEGIKWRCEFKPRVTKRLGATADKFRKVILFRNYHGQGINMGMLIHEMAHEKGKGHDWMFKLRQTELLNVASEITNNFSSHYLTGKKITHKKIYKKIEQFDDDYFYPPKKKTTVVEIKEPDKESEDDLLETAISILEDTAKTLPTFSKPVITMAAIGIILKRLNISTTENIMFIRSYLKIDYSVA